MSDVLTWAVSAASNNAAVPDGWPENMNYSAVNNCAREMMAAIARITKDNNGSIVTAGTGNAYTATINQNIVSYSAGLRFAIKANRNNTGPATLNLNSVGAAPIVDLAGQALRWYDIRNNGVYQLVYDGTNFIALNINTLIDFTGKVVNFTGAIGAIPGGWRLADGTSGTPNLRDRFVVGAGSAYAVGATGGATSANTSANGNHNHTTDAQGGHSHNIGIAGTAITVDQMPPHNHVGGGAYRMINPNAGTGGISNGFSGGMGQADIATNGGGQPHSHGASADWQGQHGHNISYSGDHSHSLSLIPPYYALAYIVRTAA